MCATYTINILNTSLLVLLSKIMFVIRAEIHKMFVKIAKWEYPDLGLCCSSRRIW